MKRDFLGLGYGTEEQIAKKIKGLGDKADGYTTIIRDDDAAVVGAEDWFFLMRDFSDSIGVEEYEQDGGTVSAAWYLDEFLTDYSMGR